MILDSIALSNWMAYAGDQILTGLPTGAIAVVAKYADNERRSNWAGKTALLEAIEWALFGVHRKRYEDDLITYGADQVAVRLTMSDGSTVERARTRGKATRLTVTVGGVVSAKKAAEEAVKALVGFDAADYRATVCFAQGDTEAIVERTSADRRKIVAQWLELDAWLRVSARARQHARAVTAEHAEIESELAFRFKDLEAAGDPDLLRKSLGPKRAELELIRSRLKETDAKLEAVAQAEIQRQDAVRLSIVTTQATEVRERLAGNGVRASDLEAAREKLVEVSTKATAATAALDSARSLRRGEFDGTCPVTCEECPIAEDIRGNRTAAEAKLVEARAVSIIANEKQLEIRTEVRDLERRDREAANMRQRYGDLVTEAKRLAAAIEERATTLPEGWTDHAVARLKDDRMSLREAEVAILTGLREAETEIDRIDALTTWVNDAREKVTAIAAKARAATIANIAVGTSGIPAAIAEAALTDLEARANAILSGTGLSFEFGWDRETKTITPACDSCGYLYKGTRDKECPACDEPRGMKRADELEILVKDDTAEIEDVKAKSGGAKVLIGTAIRLAAGLMLRERRGARGAWASIDEPFGALDSENRETLARTFAGMLSAVGLEQAFVVSHDADLLDALPARIEILRNGDISTLRLIA